MKTYECIIDGEVHFTYIKIDEIPEKYKEEFLNWMRGQTCSIVDGNMFVIYSWDWERWLDNKLNGTPLIFD